MPGVDEILEFWFGVTRHNIASIPEWSEFWFKAGVELDEPIRERFGGTLEDAIAGDLDKWAETASGRMALIIVLDQFSRNVYRGTPTAFAQDEKSLGLTQEGIIRGHDGLLSPVERAFFYMPMQHTESIAVQTQSVSLYEALADSVPEDARKIFENFTGHARLHRDIIARFGRFPHRNGILGRESTEEERAYLGGDAPTFGQA